MKNMRWTTGLWATTLMMTLAAGPSLAAKAEVSSSTSKVAVFRLAGTLREAPAQFDFGFGGDQELSLYTLLDCFNKAKKDDDVKAVVLLFDNPVLGWAQRQELRRSIRDLEAADKDVYCLLEEAQGSAYQIASAASRICMVPTGSLDLIGLHAEQMYLKGLLDKVHVEADIEHIGAYKSAGEVFTRTGPSDESKEMLDWLIRDLYEQMIQDIAEDRQRTPEEVKALIDRGPFSAKEALEAKLIDEITYPEKFVESVKERYGENAKFVHNYGRRKMPEMDLSSPFGLFKFFGEVMAKGKERTKPQIAIVYLDGMIVTGQTEEGFFGDSGTVGSTSLRRVLAKVRNDEQIKVVVLRVSSPGGSATASDIIWHAASELGDKKTLVVSMGDVAASGGYYVSVGGETIFADPGTITGSIGVVGGKIITGGLWEWIGITQHEVQYGKNADLFNTNRKFTDEQRAIIHTYMQDVYDAFTDRVKQGRGDRIKEDMEQIAGGRVYTGRQAKAKGLVDNLGGLLDAIKFAATEANVSNYEIREFPEPKNFFEMLFKGLTGEKEDEDGDTVQITASQIAATPAAFGWLARTPAAQEALGLIRRIDPVKADAVLNSLMRLEILGREGVLLALPADIIVR